MRLTLKAKMTIVILVIALILSGTSIIMSNIIFSRFVDYNYRDKAENLAKTVALMVDSHAASKLRHEVMEIYDSIPDKVTSEDWGSDAFNEYVANYSSINKGRAYRTLYNTLHFALIANKVDSVYLYSVDPVLKNAIYLLDASEEPCPIGCIDQLDLNEVNLRVIDNPEIGFPPFITNTKEYGWLVTAGVPLYDNEGFVSCYAMVDISMAEIKRAQRNFTLLVSVILTLITFVICILSILIVNYSVTKPISKISNAAVQYCNESTDCQRNGFSLLDIHTGDEIEDLAESMKHMEHDLNEHIRTILDTMHELTVTRAKADEMSVLAHKDALTGLRNKAAYDNEILRLKNELANGMCRFGIAMIDLNFLKSINDSFGHDKGDYAIKALCKIICDIYDHSPVFRIGGDEFAVILENSDFDHAAELEDIFKKHIEDLQKNMELSSWERVSAAIGVAIYDKSIDSSVENVFKRADTLMYSNKKAMKAERIG